MAYLPNLTLSEALLREHLAQAGVLLTEAIRPGADFAAFAARANESAVADEDEDEDEDEELAADADEESATDADEELAADADEALDADESEVSDEVAAADVPHELDIVAAVEPIATGPVTHAPGVSVTGPTALRPGDPLTGQLPVLVSQDFQPVDAAGARQLAAAAAEPMTQVTCLVLQLPTKDAVALLARVQEMHELETQLGAGEAPVLAPLALASEARDDASGDHSGPATLQLYGRMDAEDGARRSELFHTTQLSYHRNSFAVDFENLLVVAEDTLDPEKSPAANMYERWNQGVDAARAALNVSLNREDYLRQAVIRQARQKGYDGIQYGTEWVQLIPA